MPAKVCEMVLPAIERHGPIEVWIIDDTSFRSTAPIPLACTINIVASLASRPIVRW